MPLKDRQGRFEYDSTFDKSTAEWYDPGEIHVPGWGESSSMTGDLKKRLSGLSIRSKKRRSRVSSGGDGEEGENGSRSGVSSVVGSPQSPDFSYRSADWPSATTRQPADSSASQTHEGSATPTSLNSAMSTPVTHSGVSTLANSPVETRRMTLPPVPEDTDAPPSSASGSSPITRHKRFSLGSIRSARSPHSPSSPTSTRNGDPWGAPGAPGESSFVDGDEWRRRDPGWVRDRAGQELFDLLKKENDRRERANGVLGRLRSVGDETVPTNVGDRTVKNLYVNPKLSSWGGEKSDVPSTKPKERKPPHVLKQGLPGSPDATLFGEGFGPGTEAFESRPKKEGFGRCEESEREWRSRQKVQVDRTEAREFEGDDAGQSVDVGDDEDAGDGSAEGSSQPDTLQTQHETLASRRKRGKAGKARELSVNTVLASTYDTLPPTVE